MNGMCLAWDELVTKPKKCSIKHSYDFALNNSCSALNPENKKDCSH